MGNCKGMNHDKELETTWDKRNRQLGLLLKHARSARGETITSCAAFIRTSRQRYALIEAGKIPIQVVELEALMQYLELPAERIWQLNDASDEPEDTLVVRVLPGQNILVVYDAEANIAAHNSQAFATEAVTSIGLRPGA